LVDIDEARLEFAKDYCADEVYQLEWQYGDSIAEAKEMATLIAEAIGQSDIIYECTGASACLQAAIYVHLLLYGISDILVGDAGNTNWNGRNWTTDTDITDT